MLNRMISLFLCAVMVISMLPAQAMAMETESEPVEVVLETGSAEEAEPEEGRTEPPEAEDEPVEAETEPEEAETEPQETGSAVEETVAATEAKTEPTEEPSVPAEPELVWLDASDLDSEDLLLGFLNPLYNGGGVSFFGSMAGERLSDANRHLYEGLKAQITKIARGEEDYVKITVDFTNTECSGEDIEINLVQEALIQDHPFEMYWYSGCWYGTDPDYVMVVLRPNDYYITAGFDPNTSPYIDKEKTQKAAASAEMIYDIKAKYETCNDYDKLAAYADEICALVEYDHTAADTNSFETNINPWTLINVFDGDPTTNVVCEGYAEAFQYLCDESVFDGVVVCYSATGNNHKWNIVRIEGISYLMDVTHCDYGDYAYRGPKFLGGGSGSITEGYYIGDFHYWYYDATLNLWGTGEDSILKLSATQYTPPEYYSIVYDANGGTGGPNSQRKTQGVGLTLRDTVPTRTGYAFLGWATSPTATAADYQPGEAYLGDADVVLYAVWEQTGCAHSFGDYGVTIEATCEASGAEERVCTLCGETESREIPALGHSEKILEKVPATCTSDGLTEGSYCSVCEEILNKQEVIPAGHTVVDEICTVCGVYGTCGSDLTWSFDPASGDLAISGTGVTQTYTAEEPAPWYGHREQIRKVILAEGVTRVNHYLFADCTGLTGVVLPPSVTNISRYAFSGCSSLRDVFITDLSTWAAGSLGSTLLNCNENEKNLHLNGEQITALVIPDEVAYIGTSAFTRCAGITSVTLPDSVISLGNAAFQNCSGLTRVVLPKNLESLGNAVFQSCTALTEIVLPDSVTSMGSSVFSGCSNLESVTLPQNLSAIGNSALKKCGSLSSIILPDSVASIGEYAFSDCTGIETITFQGSAPSFAETAFAGVVATACYPANDPAWTSDVLLNYGGTITWVPYGVKNRITLDAAELNGQTSVWIDGKEFAVQTDGDTYYVDLPDGNAKTMTVYTYGTSDGKEYPIGMKVWTLENDGGFYTATRQTAFDDILQYAGSSIRVTGKKGIRMITAIDQADKTALTGDGLAGYTLKEYGTAIAWASQISENKPLVLGESYVRSNYAYKQGVADPVFANKDGKMQYTNVLVNFSDAQCSKDIAMRPYMILTDGENDITLYGGIVERSIGYIALQNKDTFTTGTEEYNYIWNIIHTVYGDAYDK